MKISTIILLAIATLTVNSNCQNISNDSSKFMLGSEKYLNRKCNDSCLTVYKNYTVITKEHKDSPGEEIIVVENKTKKRFSINVKDETEAQYFFGIVNDKFIVDAGTYVVRSFYVFDLSTHKVLFKSTYCQNLKYSNGSISYSYVYTKDKPKIMPSKKQKEEIEKIGVDFGIVEDRVYDLQNNKIIFTGKPKYSTY